MQKAVQNIYSLMSLEIIRFHEMITMICAINISKPPKFSSHPFNLLLLLLLVLFIVKPLNIHKSNHIYLGTLSLRIRLGSCLNYQKELRYLNARYKTALKDWLYLPTARGATCHSCKPDLDSQWLLQEVIADGRNP